MSSQTEFIMFRPQTVHSLGFPISANSRSMLPVTSAKILAAIVHFFSRLRSNSLALHMSSLFRVCPESNLSSSTPPLSTVVQATIFHTWIITIAPCLASFLLSCPTLYPLQRNLGNILKHKPDHTIPMLENLQLIPISLRIKANGLTRISKIPDNLNCYCSIPCQIYFITPGF